MIIDFKISYRKDSTDDDARPISSVADDIKFQEGMQTMAQPYKL